VSGFQGTLSSRCPLRYGNADLCPCHDRTGATGAIADIQAMHYARGKTSEAASISGKG